MMTKAGEQPTITQADIDAAKLYLQGIGPWKLEEIGICHDDPLVEAFAKHRTTSLAAQDQQVLALVEAARDAGDVLQSAASPSNLDPQYSDQIAALGERIGYGALMHGASALWRKSLGDLAGSEFAAGPCVSTAASRLARLDDALMPFRGETLPDAPSLAAQDLVDCETCCGNGEVVTDWERYKHPHDGDVGDEAVADCPDCDGNGKIEVPSLAAQDGLVEALERCAQIVEQWNHRQNEKVDDIKYIVRNALSAIKGDKS